MELLFNNVLVFIGGRVIMFKMETSTKYLLTALIVLAFANPLFSQSNLISNSGKGYDNLSSAQKIKYDRLESSGSYDTIWLANLNSLVASQSNGIVRLYVPEAWQDTIEFQVKYSEYESDSNYMWVGYWTGNPDTTYGIEYARLLLLSDSNEKCGQLVVNDKIHEYFDLGSGDVICGTFKNQTRTFDCDNQSNSGGSTQSYCNGDCAISVYFHYTPLAFDSEVSMKARINLALAEANISLRNSKVGQGIKFVLAGYSQLSIAEPTSYVTQITNFSVNSSVLNQRNSSRADIMCLLRSTDQDGGLYGLAFNLRAVPEKYEAFIVVQSTRLTYNNAFTHECGHVIGCMHTPSGSELVYVDNQFGDYPSNFYSNGFVNRLRTKYFQTIMDNGNSEVIIDYFSNPNVEYKLGYGVTRATGNTESQSIIDYKGDDLWSHNSRQLNEQACRVANFYANSSPLVGWITGPEEVCITQTETFEFEIYCGSAGIFEWYYSYDGINYTQASSTTSTYNHVMPSAVIGEVLFIKGIVKGVYPATHRLTYYLSVPIDYILPCN